MKTLDARSYADLTRLEQHAVDAWLRDHCPDIRVDVDRITAAPTEAGFEVTVRHLLLNADGNRYLEPNGYEAARGTRTFTVDRVPDCLAEYER